MNTSIWNSGLDSQDELAGSDQDLQIACSDQWQNDIVGENSFHILVAGGFLQQAESQADVVRIGGLQQASDLVTILGRQCSLSQRRSPGTTPVSPPQPRRSTQGR